MLPIIHLEHLDLIFRIEKQLHLIMNVDDSAFLRAALSLMEAAVESARQVSMCYGGAHKNYTWLVRKH
jgi:hypothetical protein